MKYILSLIAILFVGTTSQAQCLPAKSVQVTQYLNTSNRVSLSAFRADSTAMQNRVAQLKVKVTLETLENVAVVHLKLGHTEGGFDIFQRDYNIIAPDALPAGEVFSIDGNVVTLTIGEFTGLNDFYTSITLESIEGALSLPLIKHNQTN